MRNRNHTFSLVAVGLFIACASPAFAADPSETADKSAQDHDCSLPANIRNKVEHCNQVGDFAGPHRESYLDSKPLDRKNFRSAPALPSENIPTPGLSAGSKKVTKQKKPNKDAKKDQIIEIKSDSEPQKNAK